MHKSLIIYQSNFETGFDTLAEAAAAAEAEGVRWIITERTIVAWSRPLEEGRTSKSLRWYLKLAEALSKAARMFTSTKLYGQYVAAELPESQALDTALRSNCKWLFEHQDEVVRVPMPSGGSLHAYKSACPTVIRRAYRTAVEKAEKAGSAVEEPQLQIAGPRSAD